MLIQKVRLGALKAGATCGCILAAILAVIPAATSHPEKRQTSPDQMSFKVYEPTAVQSIVLGSARDIYASGPIDSNAPERFAAFVKQHQIPACARSPDPTARCSAYSTVVLDSPGGNLAAGMKLGQMIRSFGFDTEVGKDSGKMFNPSTGSCFSACTLTFLGGQWRYVKSGSLFGVHRFAFQKQVAAEGDLSQIVSAAVVEYVRDMGVDEKFFSEMATSGANEINLLSEPEMETLGVVNNGIGPTVWSVESTHGLVYLKGQRDSVWGRGKFMLGCSGQTVHLMVMFDSEGRDEEAPAMKAISLEIDDTAYPIEEAQIGKTQLVNGYVSAEFGLSPQLVGLISSAHSVGIAFQYARDAATLIGFQDMSFAGAAEKLPGVLRGCVAGTHG